MINRGFLFYRSFHDKPRIFIFVESSTTETEFLGPCFSMRLRIERLLVVSFSPDLVFVFPLMM